MSGVPEILCHEDMTRLRGGKCCKLEYGYTANVLTITKFMGNPGYFALK